MPSWVERCCQGESHGAAGQQGLGAQSAYTQAVLHKHKLQQMLHFLRPRPHRELVRRRTAISGYRRIPRAEQPTSCTAFGGAPLEPAPLPASPPHARAVMWGTVLNCAGC